MYFSDCFLKQPGMIRAITRIMIPFTSAGFLKAIAQCCEPSR